jgi:hypothetical protein
VCIEVKARRAAALPHIIINSEFQLDDSTCDFLFLHVVDLDQVPAGTDSAFTLTAIARRLRDNIQCHSADAAVVYERLLAAAGFRWEDDYSDSEWIEGTGRLYRVTGDFPRITAQVLTAGVSGLRYTVLLRACEPYLINQAELHSALGGHYGN